MSERTIIVGDVHGCAQELDDLLEACAFTDGDNFVSVGDLVAKGPNSKGVIDRVRSIGGSAIRGNHEQHCLRWWDAKLDGGKLPRLRPDHAEVQKSLTEDDWRWLSALPLWLELPEHGCVVVHAGLVPDRSLAEQRPYDLMNMRSIRKDGKASKAYDDGEPWPTFWQGPELVVFGHDAIRGLQQHPHAIGLDTGCVYGGHLSALILPSKQIVSVPARKSWASVG